MNPQTTDLEAIRERVAKLERENRRTKQAGTVVLILAASLLLMGQAPATRTVEANEFVLKDSSGTVRGRFVVDEFGPRLHLLDANGAQRVELEAGGLTLLEPRQGTSFRWTDLLPSLLSNPQPGVHLRLSCSGTPSVCSPTLTLMGSDQNYEVSLRADRDRSVLTMGEAGGTLDRLREVYNLGDKAPPPPPKPTMFLSANENGSTFELQDRQGFLTSIGNTGLVTPRTGQTRQTSAASVVLFGKDKKVLWQAP